MPVSKQELGTRSNVRYILLIINNVCINLHGATSSIQPALGPFGCALRVLPHTKASKQAHVHCGAGKLRYSFFHQNHRLLPPVETGPAPSYVAEHGRPKAGTLISIIMTYITSRAQILRIVCPPPQPLLCMYFPIGTHCYRSRGHVDKYCTTLWCVSVVTCLGFMQWNNWIHIGTGHHLV